MRYIKISSTGEQLPVDAAIWAAVLDTTTNLMWSAENIGTGRVEWSEAKTAASAVDLCGHTDWRLPTIKELFSIVDHDRSEPAIDIAFFPSCKPNWYWSSSPLAANPADYAWGVNFYDGGAHYGDQDGNGFVRAVRSVASLPGQ